MENQLNFLRGYSYFNDRNKKGGSEQDSEEEMAGTQSIGPIKVFNVHCRKKSINRAVQFESFCQNKFSLKNMQTVMSTHSDQSEGYPIEHLKTYEDNTIED